jgi:hypothetical protein
LCNGIEAAISGFSYPPRQGTYDGRGNIVALGELTTVGTALTFEEVRAALHGLVLCGGSTGAQRVEIYRAINALVETVAGLGLTKAQFADAWRRVFAVPNGTVIDAHHDPALPPTLSAVGAAGITLGFLGAPPVGTNPQTDAAQRITFTVTAGAIASETELISVTFATPYRWRRSDGTALALTPAIMVNSSYRTFRINSPSSTGYKIATLNPLNNGDTVDLLVSVNPGIATV